MVHQGTREHASTVSVGRSFSSPPAASQNLSQSSAPEPLSDTPVDTCTPDSEGRTVTQRPPYQSRITGECSAGPDTPLSNDNSQNHHYAPTPHATPRTGARRLDARPGPSSDTDDDQSRHAP